MGSTFSSPLIDCALVYTQWNFACVGINAKQFGFLCASVFVACGLQYLWHEKCDVAKTVFFSNAISLTYWAQHAVGLSWLRVFPLAIGSQLMLYWCRQYYAYRQSHPLMVTNPKSTTAAHWGISDGTRWRDLIVDLKTNVVHIRPPKPLRVGFRPNLFYVPFYDFGVLGEGNLDHQLDVPRHYNDMKNTCQTYALNLAQASGYSIFKIPEHFVCVSSLVAFAVTHLFFVVSPGYFFELLYRIKPSMYWSVVTPLQRLYSFKRIDQLDVSEYSEKIIRTALKEYFARNRYD